MRLRLLLVALLSVAVLAACSDGADPVEVSFEGREQAAGDPREEAGPPTPSPQPAELAAPDGPSPIAVPDLLLPSFQLAAAGAEPAVDIVNVGDAPPSALTVALDRGDSPGAVRLLWVPVLHISREVPGVTMEGLRQAWAEGFASWQPLTGEVLDLHLYLPDGAEEYLRAALGVDIALPPSTRVLPSTEVAGAVAADPLALAFLPLADVDFRVRSLAVDGIDVANGTGAPIEYPLATRLAVESTDGDLTEVLRVAEQLQPGLDSPGGPPVRMAMIGDIAPARCVYQRHVAYDDFASSWRGMAEFLWQFDYRIGDLEIALTDTAEALGCTPTFYLVAPKRTVEGLVHGRVDLVTVANNHVKDAGEEAFVDFLGNLEEAGIAYVGGGRNITEAREPHIATIDGTRFAFLGYDDVASQWYGAGENLPGTAPIDLATLGEDIARAREQADVVVVMFQWGFPEYYLDPLDTQKAVAEAAMAAGADFVYGDGPHVPQGLGLAGRAPVIYSMGNFIFDQDWCRYTMVGYVTEVVFRGPRVTTMRLHPYIIEDMHQPRPATNDEVRDMLDLVYDATERLRTGSLEPQRQVCQP